MLLRSVTLAVLLAANALSYAACSLDLDETLLLTDASAEAPDGGAAGAEGAAGAAGDAGRR
jgi:hypothetical protein